MSEARIKELIHAVGGSEGMQSAFADSAATGATTIVAAPGAGFRLRIFSILISGHANATVTSSVTVGTAMKVYAAAGTTFNVQMNFPKGLILAANTALSRTASSAPQSLACTASYIVEKV